MGTLPATGDVIAGKYRVVRVLGEGGMGVVLEAEHVKLRQHVAIKFLNPEMLNVAEVVKRFEREARAAAKLRSPNVARVMDVETTTEGVPYMVMELLAGRDLEAEREERKVLPHEELVDYILQACSGLAEAHAAGIVHRDLKPGNLFLAREPDDERITVKVLDFGISKVQEDEGKLTSAGAVMGTALYMSPEQVKGTAVDPRSDVWSLGVILYELLCGEPPWIGPAPRVAACIVSEPVPPLVDRAPNVPPALAHVIDRMLEKDKERRLGSIAEVARALAPFAREGSPGRAAAEQISRKASRASDPSLSAPAVSAAPSGQRPFPAFDRTEPLGEVRSTMSAQTVPHHGNERTRAYFVMAVVACLVVAVAGVALIVKSRGAQPVTAKPEGPPVTASATPPSAPASASASASALATSEAVPSATTSASPSTSASASVAAKPAAVRPKSSAPAVASATGPATKPATTASAEVGTNPLFLK